MSDSFVGLFKICNIQIQFWLTKQTLAGPKKDFFRHFAFKNMLGFPKYFLINKTNLAILIVLQNIKCDCNRYLMYSVHVPA